MTEKNDTSIRTSSSDQATTVPGSLQSTTLDPLTSIFNNNDNFNNNNNNLNDLAASLTSDHFYNNP